MTTDATEVARLREALKTITGLVATGATKGVLMAECRSALFPELPSVSGRVCERPEERAR